MTDAGNGHISAYAIAELERDGHIESLRADIRALKERVDVLGANTVMALGELQRQVGQVIEMLKPRPKRRKRR